MGPTWSGAPGVLAEAVAQLVGHGAWWGRRRPKGRAATPVVVELAGGEAADAMELMEHLAGFRTRMPVNSPAVFADPRGGTADVAGLLDDAAKWFSYPGMCKRRRPLRFRRFRMAQQAYEAWCGGDGVGADQVRRLQENCERAVYRERGGLLHELNRLRSQAVGENLKADAALYFGGATLAAITLVPVAEWLVRHFWVHRPARRWFQRKLGASAPAPMYAALCNIQSLPREVWHQWLMDAFLADIDAYYHLGRRLNATRLPLLLLPDAAPDRPAGAFLRHLRAEQTGTPVARVTSPVAVAHVGDAPADGADDMVVTELVVAAVQADGHVFALPRTAPSPVGGGEPVRVRLTRPGPVTSAISAVLALSLVAGVWGLAGGVVAGQSCGQGLTLAPLLSERDGQCVGVSDGTGGNHFMPRLEKVVARIAAENARVASEDTTVTVAYLAPMTPDARDGDEILADVQGAYLAQQHANQDARIPDIRLVLANPGRGWAHWRAVTDELTGMTGDRRHPLRAVTGFDLEGAGADAALAALLRAGVPVVGGQVTADDLENTLHEGELPAAGLARVAASPTDQARALAGHRDDASAKDSLLVMDTRPDDAYTTSLGWAFGAVLDVTAAPRRFTSPAADEAGDVADQFRGMTGSICASHAKNIYFAGRPLHLALFLRELAEAPCPGAVRRVITASGGAAVTHYLTDYDWRLLREHQGDLTVEYAALGHRDTWSEAAFDNEAEKDFNVGSRLYPVAPGTLTRDIRDEAADLRGALGAPVDWENADAMTAFDTVWLAANALATVSENNRGRIPTLQALARQWSATSSLDAVPGLTGWLCLSDTGDPYNKPVTVVRLDPSHRGVRFDAVSWPQGHPSVNGEVPAAR